MKKLIMFCLILAMAFTVKAQTKQETIDWLKEKLEMSLTGTNTAKTGSGTFVYLVKNVKLESINECEFTISYTKEQTNYKRTFPTNIKAIKNIYENSFMDEIECWSFSYNAKIVKVQNITDGETHYTDDGWGIHIDKREENIHSRIEKALKHLATFCPKKKETF